MPILPFGFFSFNIFSILSLLLLWYPLCCRSSVAHYGSIPSNLTHLFVLFRHGDRAPLGSYPNDPNKNYSWPMGLGALTTKGRRNMHALGKYLRRRYGSFLGSDPRVVAARSGPDERCYDSLALVLYGLFPTTGPWKDWMPDQDWQPVPIVRLPQGHDRFTEICKPLFLRSIQNLGELQARGSFAKSTFFFKFLSKHTGVDIRDTIGLLTAIDTLVVHHENGLSVPQWALDNWDTILWANDVIIGHIAESQMRNTAGAMLWSIADDLEKLRKKIEGVPQILRSTPSKVGKKVTIFSYNDINLYNVLKGLNRSYEVRPQYGATVLFEVYSKNRVPFINILHKVDRDAQIYSVEGGSNPSTAEAFIRFVRNQFKPVSYEECKWTKLQLL
ncbi:testicular acid phosphatase homolog [Ornithodoros turicata]|uniref:testicular acid phosphatase homolog n=1 Tax=Ornithodoros turicata TaxID=34597 RepID=UPI003138DD7E